MRFFLHMLVCMSLYVSSVQARPVSYPGGWTLMLNHTGEYDSAHIHYSPTAKFSLGYKAEHWRADLITLHLAQMNSLLKRWNKKHSQANVYLKTGLGLVDSDHLTSSSSGMASFIGFVADWEDRRFFVSYSNRYTDMSNYGHFFMQSARVGIAPYEGDYGDLHTWLMVEVNHTPEGEHNLSVMPLIRLFKSVHLLEVGMTNHGDATLRYIFRY